MTVSEWGWVILAFVVAYGSVGGYLAVLRIRAVRVARQLHALQGEGTAR